VRRVELSDPLQGVDDERGLQLPRALGEYGRPVAAAARAVERARADEGRRPPRRPGLEDLDDLSFQESLPRRLETRAHAIARQRALHECDASRDAAEPYASGHDALDYDLQV